MSKHKDLSKLIESLQVVDLSHLLEENIPIWPTHTKFIHSEWSSRKLGDGANNYMIMMNEHNGTHIDLPSHVIDLESALTTENMSIKKFMGIYKRLDFVEFKNGRTVEKEDLLLWESNHGQIEKDDILLLDFGWGKRWKLKPDDKAYFDNWPGIGQSAAQYLVEKEIKLVGVDTIAADVLSAKGSPAHQILLGHNICIMENLNNLDIIDDEGYFVAQPLKLKDGTGSPIRPYVMF